MPTTRYPNLLCAAEQARQDVVELLRNLVRFRTENPKFIRDQESRSKALQEGREFQRFIAAILTELDCEVDMWEIGDGQTNVVARLAGSGGGKSLILNGHIDVVPAGAVGEWPHDPWSAELADGKIWGRGSCDMKGGLAAGICALKLIREAGLELRGDVLLQAVADEEGGGGGTRAALDRGYGADAAIVLEPSNQRLIIAEGGLEWLRIVVRGVGGHSAKRYRSVHAGGRGEAVNAIEKLVKVLVALQELERNWANRKLHPLLPPGITTIHPGVIVGGSGGGCDGVPTDITTIGNFSDYASLGLSIKYLPNEQADDVRREVERYVRAVAVCDPWLEANQPELEWGVNGVCFPPAELPSDHELVTSLERACGRLNIPVSLGGFEAVSDLAWLHDAGIPSVLLGPGSIDQAHTTHEFIELNDLIKHTALIAASVLEWCEYC